MNPPFRRTRPHGCCPATFALVVGMLVGCGSTTKTTPMEAGVNADAGVDAGSSVDADTFADAGDATVNSGDHIVAVAAGTNTTVALSGNGDLYLWGDNFGGRYLPEAAAELLSPTLFPGFTDVQAVSVGDAHVCVVNSRKEAFCLGSGRSGQLGNNTEESSATAILVNLNDVEAIYAGYRMTCAIAGSSRQLYCWGRNNVDQLGLGEDAENEVLVPTAVPNMTQVAEVTGGEDMVCARMLSGTVRCTGDGRSGELGNGMFERSNVFVDVVGFTNFTMIASGDDHTCGVLGSRDLVCWGTGTNALSLGQAEAGNQSSPVAVSGASDTRAVASGPGSGHTCITTDRNTVACFGRNTSGQLGQGTVDDGFGIVGVARPEDVSGMPPINAVTVGESHSCALDQNGEVWCWGANFRGEAGLEGQGSNVSSPQKLTFS